MINRISKSAGLFSRDSESVPRERLDSADVVDSAAVKYSTLPSSWKRHSSPVQLGRETRESRWHNGRASSVQKPSCPPSLHGDGCAPIVEHGQGPQKPSLPPRINARLVRHHDASRDGVASGCIYLSTHLACG